MDRACVRLSRVRQAFLLPLPPPGSSSHLRCFHSFVWGAAESVAFLAAAREPGGLPASPAPAAEVQAQCLESARYRPSAASLS